MLKSSHASNFLHVLYGNEPAAWDPLLQGVDRFRFIVNCFTRMRYCYEDGRLNLKNKGPLRAPHEGMLAWFHIKDRIPLPTRILFGHWASLECVVDVPHIFGLDSGCVWGSTLTAMRLEDGHRFSVSC